MRILAGVFSFSFSLIYLWTNFSLIKPFPAFSLIPMTDNIYYKISLFLTGIGDFFLDKGYLGSSLVFFGGCHLFLMPKGKLIIPWYLLLVTSQLIWLYFYLSYNAIAIVLYTWIVSILLWNRVFQRSQLSLAVLLYAIADIIVLVNLILEELNIRYLSLVLYWLSLWLIATDRNRLEDYDLRRTIGPKDQRTGPDCNSLGQHFVDTHGQLLE